MTFSSSFSEIVTFCPQYWASLRPEDQKYGENQAPSVTIYIFGVSKNIFSITGCPKNGLNFDLFFFIFWNCHFLPSILSVTEARRTIVWWESGPQCHYLYLWSVKKKNSHYRASQKWSKFWLFFFFIFFIFWNCHFLPSILTVTEAKRTKSMVEIWPPVVLSIYLEY